MDKIDNDTNEQIKQARKKLLDLTMRNSLLNYRHSEKSMNYIRIVNNSICALYNDLISGKKVELLPLPDLPSEPKDEKTPEFNNAFEIALLTDEKYLAAKKELDTKELIDSSEEEKIIRDLKNRVREKLALPPLDSVEITKKEWAIENHINPDYENRIEDINITSSSAKNIAQTLLYPIEFKRRIQELRRIIHSDQEEKGIDTFYIALGFLEWYDQTNSDTKHQAPLLLLKLENLVTDTKQRKILFSSSGDAIITNLSLSEKLKEFNLELPKYDEQCTPQIYFDQISKMITSYPKWQVRSYITVGRFIFSRLVMYEDINPENWKHILTHKGNLLKDLFESRTGNPPFEDPDPYDIDKNKEVQNYAPILVTDADSSQHSAIVDVMKGNNLIIKGPPGTGKSQTITNLISNALYSNKTVLFMAEKKAALDVVFSRLKQAGLEDYCFELHSDKTNSSHIRDILGNSYRRYINAVHTPHNSTDCVKIDQSISEKKELRNYYDVLQEKVGSLGCTLFDAIWQDKKLEKFIRKYPKSFETIHIQNISSLTAENFKSDLDALKEIEQLYIAYQESINNLKNWNNIKSCSLKTQTVRSLLNQTDILVDEINSILENRNDWDLKDCVHTPTSLDDIKRLFEFAKQYLKQINEYHIDNHWLLSINENNLWEEIKIFSEQLAHYKELFLVASDIYVDPLHAIQIDKNLDNIYQNLQHSNIQDKQLNELLDIQSSLNQEIQYWKSSKKLHDIACLVYQKSELSIGEICAIKDILSEVSEVINILPFYSHNFEMFKPSNWGILDKAEKAITTIQEDNLKLSKIFDIDTLQDVDNIDLKIRKAIKGINSAGFFTLFNKEYKCAVRLYNLYAVASKTKRNEMLQNFKLLFKYMVNYKELSTNVSFAKIIGEHFNGIKTEINEIREVHHFVKKVYDIGAKYGEDVSTSLRTFFFTPDNFETFAKIAGLVTNFEQFSLTLDKIDYTQSYTDYNIKLNKLNNLILSLDSNFINLFKTNTITIPEIIKNRRLLSQLKELGDKIEISNNIINHYLPNFAHGSKSSIDLFQNISLMRELLENNFHISNKNRWLQIASENKLPEIVDRLEKYNNQILKINEHILQIEDLFLFGGQNYVEGNYIYESMENLLNYFQSLLNNKDAIYNICAFYDKLSFIKGSKYENVILYLKEHNYPLHNLPEIYSYLVYHHLAEKFEDKRWDNYVPNRISKISENIRSLENEIYKLNGKRVIEKLNKKDVPIGINSNRVSEKTELQLIQHQLSGNSRAIPLRRFIQRAGLAVQALKPCFLMSPMTVAQYIAPKSIVFDLLIIDEASQMYFEEALGGIFRAKQIVVVGDEKQLPPTPFFQKRTAQEDEFDEELDVSNDLSILETCIVRGFKWRELLWHYRSKDSSLIEFSNTKFYNDSLKIFPSPVISSDLNGVRFIPIKGIYKNRQNEEEADAIIREIKRFVKKYPERSLGIATINSTQKTLLDKKCELLYEQDENFKAYFDKWQSKLESFFVKNLENIQGDERDYIFVSTVYGPESKDGRILQRFGPINSKYGHRRLNVLFTRAKYGLRLFTSLKDTDIIIDQNSSTGLKTFRDYLHYADTHKIESGKLTHRNFDSDFEKMVYDLLTDKGYEVDKQVGVKGFFIDLAVKHPLNKAYYALGIECDGAPYHSTKSARDRDCIRQAVLESLGWKIYRIWSKDWFYNTQKEIEKLLKKLDEIATIEPKIEYVDNNDVIDVSEQKIADKNRTLSEISAYNIQSTLQQQFDFDEYFEKETDNDLVSEKIANTRTSSIESQVKNVEINDIVKYIRQNDNTEHTIQITPAPSAPEQGLINQNTPLALALLDNVEEGEEVEVNGKTILVKKIIKNHRVAYPE